MLFDNVICSAAQESSFEGKQSLKCLLQFLCILLFVFWCDLSFYSAYLTGISLEKGTLLVQALSGKFRNPSREKPQKTAADMCAMLSLLSNMRPQLTRRMRMKLRTRLRALVMIYDGAQHEYTHMYIVCVGIHGAPIGALFCPEIRAFTGFGARFLQPFPKSLVTVKYCSNTKMAVNGR